MKNRNFAAITILAFTLASYSSLHAATIVASATKPAVGSDDVSSYVTASTHFVGGDDYTNNYSNGNGSPGQTFTVTTSGSMTAITVQGGPGQAGNGYQTGAFTLGVYSVGSDGTDLTYLGGGSFTFANPSTSIDYSGDYLTFDLSSAISVTSGDVYAFAISSPAGYFGLAGSGSANPYSGGSAIVVGGGKTGGQIPVSASNTTISSGGTLAYDRNFDVAIDAPEPGTWAMLIGGLLCLIVIRRYRTQD